MRQFLLPADITSNLRLTRTQFDGAFLVVEGSGSDVKVYKRQLDPVTSRMVPAHSKENLYKVVDSLDAEGFRGLLGIADADRDRLLKKAPVSPNVLLTDGADLESMLFRSSALDKILLELGSEEKIRNFEQQEQCTVREAIFRRARPLGALRLISERDNLRLTFRDLKLHRFVNRELDHDSSQMLNQVRSISETSIARALNEPQLIREIQKIATDQTISSSDLCNGHDLIAILAISLTKRLGTQKQNELSQERLERMLRLAFEHRDFRLTTLYSGIQSWQTANPPFRALPLAEDA